MTPSFLARLRAGAVAAAAAVGLALASPGASAAAVQVRDGDGGDVFSGNGVGSIGLTIAVDGADRAVAAGAFALQYRLDAASAWVDFLTYCLEPDETLGISGSTIYTGTLSTNLAGTAEYGADANALSRLYRTWFADSLTSATKSAAFQVAVWEVAYDGGGDLGTGAFRLPGAAAVAAQADAYLNPAGWGPYGDVPVVLRAGNQDLFVPVPEPAGVAVLGAGLLGLRLAARRRGRARAAAG